MFMTNGSKSGKRSRFLFGPVIRDAGIFIAGILDKDDKLLKHGALVVAVTMIGLIINYFFQILIGRMLGPVDYGIFGSLVSIVYIFTVLVATIETSITKMASEFNARNEKGKVRTLLTGYSSRLLLIGIFLFAVSFFLSNFISDVLGIPSALPILILSISFPLSFVQAVFTGLLRGLQMFTQYSVISVVGTFEKLVFGMGLVMLGFGVSGAIAGVVLSGFGVLILSFFFLRKYIAVQPTEISENSVIAYSLPILTANLLLAIITNMDVIFAKYYLPSSEAGMYAAASTLAKIILFATGAIITAMFPKVSDMNEKKKQTKSILRNGILYVFIMSIAAIILAWAFPDSITNFIFGAEFLRSSSLLFRFCIAMMIASLCFVLVNYDLAIRKNISWQIAAATVIEIALITIFHSSSLGIIDSIIASDLILLGGLIYMNRKEFF